MFTDSRTDHITHLLISHGLIQIERRLVPVTWVNAVQEDEVHLAVDSPLFDRLPPYEDLSDRPSVAV